MRTFTFKPKESPSVINERSLRAKGAKCRAKYDSLKWDGLSMTFRTFKRAIEGHLIQVGAGYMAHSAFIIAYEESVDDYLQSNDFGPNTGFHMLKHYMTKNFFLVFLLLLL